MAKNESLFREVNERIQEAASRAVLLDTEAGFVCECASVECTEPLPITLVDYRYARSEPTWFIVLKGHERPDIERIVRRLDGCLIVDKVGEAGEKAEELDPSS
jgi:hypothetical protein